MNEFSLNLSYLTEIEFCLIDIEKKNCNCLQNFGSFSFKMTRSKQLKDLVFDNLKGIHLKNSIILEVNEFPKDFLKKMVSHDIK